MSRFERWSRRKRGMETGAETKDQREQQASLPTQTPLKTADEKEPVSADLPPAWEEEHAIASLQGQEADQHPMDSSASEPESPAENIDDQLPDPDTLAPESDFSAFLQTGVSPALKRRALRRMFMAKSYNVRDGLDDYDHDFSKMRKLSSETSAQLRNWMHKLTEDADEPAEETIKEDPPVVSTTTEAEAQNPGTDAGGSSNETLPSDDKNHDNHADEEGEKDPENMEGVEESAYDPVRPIERPV
nr:DUF3306 domain-containing protein [uncultured Halomonas sp.]